MTDALSASALAARRARLTAVRDRMRATGLDALVLSLGADLPWLTGYEAMPLERLTALVVPVDGDALLVVPALEAPRVKDAGDLFRLRPWAEREDPIAIVAAALEAGPARTLAVSDRAWASPVLALQQAIPGARWRTASTVTAPLRAVKDASEVAALRAAGAAADQVAAAIHAGELRVAGRTEHEVSREISERLVAAGHDRVNFAIVGSGPNGASPHHHAGERRIGAGDVVVCDFGGAFSLDGDVGYCSDITRTVAVGDPGAEVRERYTVLQEAQAAARVAVRPGVTAGSIDAAARGVIAAAGLGDAFIHRTGHGIGIEEHEDPYMVEGNTIPLQPGHAFSVEPGIYVPGRYGMRLEDIVVVTEDGAAALNDVARDLVLVG